MAAPGVVGRETEQEAIDGFLRSAVASSATLVLDGEPGIGKTTLWRVAVEAAAADRLVLRSRPVSVEADFAYAGLTDLLAPVGDLPRVIGPVLGAALDAALLRREADGPANPRTIGTALAALLEHLAAEGPVLVAVDDVQWLDPATADALAFAARRLGVAPVGLLVARRLEAGRRSPLPLGLTDDDRVVHLELGPMNLRQVHDLVQGALGEPPTRAQAVRVLERSGGNPYFALELARAGEGPVPARLQDAVGERIRHLPPGDLDALLLVATARLATEAELRVTPAISAALDRAEAAGLLEVELGRVRFTHPLIGASVYDAATTTGRRLAHATLAERCADPEERARHLALGADGPSPAAGVALVDAAVLAGRRGAPAAAAELLALALVHLAADAPARPSAQARLARLRYQTGDTAGAGALAAELADGDAIEEAVRVDALLLLAEIEHDGGSTVGAVDRADQAIRHSGDDLALLARSHAVRALVGYDDFDDAARHARTAVEVLDRTAEADAEVRAMAVQALLGLDILRGEPFDRAAYEAVVAAEVPGAIERVSDRPSAIFASLLGWTEELDDARVLLEAARATAVAEGDDASLPFVLSHLARVEHRAGRLAEAQALGEELLALAAGLRLDFHVWAARSLLAVVAAERGDAAAARRLADAVAANARTDDDAWSTRMATIAVAHVALLDGRPADVVDDLRHATVLGDRIGMREPAYRRDQLQLAEALAATGDLDGARASLDAHRPHVERAGRPAALARFHRAEAIVLAAAGDVDAAAERLDAALAAHAANPLPFDVAQTHLTYGVVERRRRRKASAREHLEAARAGFEAIGARRQAAAATVALDRVGTRAEHGALTRTEQQVADLVALGRTNREVAAELFISPKTVEANLSRIYAKLGVRGRTELAARIRPG